MNIILNGKEGLCRSDEAPDLEVGRHPGFSSQALRVSPLSSLRGRQTGAGRPRDHRGRDWRDEAMSQGRWQPPEAGGAREQILPWSLSGRTGPAGTLILVQ